jgi:hypothetical protein
MVAAMGVWRVITCHNALIRAEHRMELEPRLEGTVTRTLSIVEVVPGG